MCARARAGAAEAGPAAGGEAGGAEAAEAAAEANAAGEADNAGGGDEDLAADDIIPVAPPQAEDADAVLAELAADESDLEDEDPAGATTQRKEVAPLHLEAPLEPRPPGFGEGASGKPGSLALARLTNVIAFEPHPFDARRYEPETEAVEDPESGTSTVRLRTSNVARWRVVRDAETGAPCVESNARLVRWSDGSTQLLVGEEAFEMSTQSIAEEHNHLFQRTSGMLLARGLLQDKVSIRPAGLDTASHKRFAAALDRRHNKASKLQETITVEDPEAEKAKREQQRASEIREAERLAQTQERHMERATRRRGADHFGGMGLDEEEEHEDEDEGAGGGSPGDEQGLPPMSEEEREARAMRAKEGGAGAGVVRRKKVAAAVEEEDADMMDEDHDAPADSLSDDSDEDGAAAEGEEGREVSAPAKKRRRAMVDDEDDGEA